jgi:hypothetical protein
MDVNNVKATIKFNDEEIITDISIIASGCECCYVQTKNRAFKLFRYYDEADEVAERQSFASKFSLGPKVLSNVKRIDIKLHLKEDNNLDKIYIEDLNYQIKRLTVRSLSYPHIHFYAYETQIAEKIPKNYFRTKDDRWDGEKYEKETKSLIKRLDTIFKNCKSNPDYDISSNNMGFIDGELTLIDFGSHALSRLPNKKELAKLQVA